MTVELHGSSSSKIDEDVRRCHANAKAAHDTTSGKLAQYSVMWLESNGLRKVASNLTNIKALWVPVFNLALLSSHMPAMSDL